MANPFDQFDEGGTAVAEKNPFDAFDAPDLSGVKLSAYEKPIAEQGVRPPSGMEPGTELTTALAEADAPIRSGMREAAGKALDVFTGGPVFRPVASELGGMASEWLRRTGIDPSSQPDKPIVPLPKSELPTTDWRRGVSDLLTGTVEGLETPENAVLMAVLPEGSIGKAAAILFGSQQVAALPEQARNAIGVLNDPDATPAQKVEAVGQPVVGSLLAGVMMKHGLKGEVPAAVKPPYKPRLGTDIQMPEGAIPPAVEPLTSPAGGEMPRYTEPGERVVPDRPAAPEKPAVAPVAPQGDAAELESLKAMETRTPEQQARLDALLAKDKAAKNQEAWQAQFKAQMAAKQKATAESMIPALRTKEGQIIPGERGKTHDDIYAAAKAKDETAGLELQVSEPEHGFLVGDKFLTRAEAARAVGESGDLHSQRLRELQKSTEPPKPAAPAPVEPAPANPAETPAPASPVPAEVRPDLQTLLDSPKRPHAESKEWLRRYDAALERYEDKNAMRLTLDESKALTARRTEIQAKLKAIESKGLKEAKQPTPAAPEAAGPGKGEGAPATMLGPGASGATGEITATGPRGEPVHGIAQRVLERRAAEGVIAPVERGEGINTPDSLERGRELLANGLSPEQAVYEFEHTKAITADAMAVVRAHGEKLAKAAYDAYDKHGINSPEYEAAWEADSAWAKRVKPMSTEWHKIGMAQQGEVEIDTGTFHGLRRAHMEDTGHDFTPAQKATAQKIAARGKKSADAEKRAKDAVIQWHRENAIRGAKGEVKERIKGIVEEMKLAKTRQEAEQRAQAVIEKARRDAAVDAAKAEQKSRLVQAELDKQVAEIERRRDQRVKDAVTKQAREDAVRKANAEKKAAVAQAERAKQVAEIERKRAQKAKEEIEKFHRDLAARRAAEERKNRADPIAHVWRKVGEYLDKGMDNFDDIRNKVATDLGMKVDQVTRLMAQDKRAKYLADDLWKKQQAARNVRNQAKRWLAGIETPLYTKALASIPKILFGLKVGFHGTVALGTHAPMVAFQPRFWQTYVRDFGKMYKMVGSKAYYERQVQDLMRRPNYITARRAGLVNDPFVYEDYNSPQTAKYFGGLTGMGNRGYTVLKIIRQDMFDQMWSKLPKTSQIPEVAQAIADGLNHATGVVKGRAPTGSNLALFAPRLEASRVMWLAGDPIRAADTFLNWKNSSIGEKTFALNQVKEKAWVAGTFFSLMALNQGFLSATGSDQKVNVTDPFKADFLKFKAAGMQASYGNPMLTMARLPLRLWVGLKNEGKLNKIIHEDENTYRTIGEYVRSQASPFAGLAADLAFGRDFQQRPLPKAGFGVLPGRTGMPKRLKEEGITTPYTWPEFWSETLSPIPFQEAIKEVWGKGMGMTDADIKRYAKAWGVLMFQAGTGARLAEDWTLKNMPPTPTSPASPSPIDDMFKIKAPGE